MAHGCANGHTQLDYAPLKLLGAILGMALLYLAGPLIFILAPVHDSATASSLGLLVWISNGLRLRTDDHLLPPTVSAGSEFTLSRISLYVDDV